MNYVCSGWCAEMPVVLKLFEYGEESEMYTKLWNIIEWRDTTQTEKNVGG
jgi:hypothetical protein